MLKLKLNPNTEEVFMDCPDTMCIYGIDGTPFGRKESTIINWPVVGEVPTLFDWQAHPERFGTEVVGDCDIFKRARVMSD